MLVAQGRRFPHSLSVLKSDEKVALSPILQKKDFGIAEGRKGVIKRGLNLRGFEGKKNGAQGEKERDFSTAPIPDN